MQRHYVKDLAGMKYTPHIVLPLAGVSFFSVQRWYVDAWLSRDNTHVILETSVRLPKYLVSRVRGEFLEADNKHFTRYAIKAEFLQDVKHFVRGHYSKISESARDMIIELSGLPYTVPQPNGLTKTHPLLVAIDPEYTAAREVLANAMSEELYGREGMLDPAGELLSEPLSREVVYFPI